MLQLADSETAGLQVVARSKQLHEDVPLPPAVAAPAAPATPLTAATLTPDQALATINTVVVQDAFILQTLAIVLGVAAIVGVGALVVYVRIAAHRIAKQGVKAYIGGQEHNENLRQIVNDEIRAQLENRMAVIVQPVTQGNGASQFPQAPKQGGE